MHKNPSFASHALRLIAAASLACTVATVGCTTDRTPGAGEPQRYAPTVGPTMPSSTPGSEQSRTVNPPMISSYTPSPRAVIVRPVDTDAIAIAAAKQSFRGRNLGPADPTGVPSYVASPQMANYATGQFVNPSDTANPQITVNSSISSQPTPVITTGGGGGFSGGVAATTAAVGTTSSAVIAGVTTTPTTAATTISPTVAANTVANATTTSAANAAAAVINNRGGLLTPTMSSGATISPTVAANPAVGNVRGSGNVINTANTVTTANNTVRTSALTTAGTGTSSGLVIGRTANGTISISNVVDGRTTTTTTQSVTTPTTTTPGAIRFH